jgi:hypothetical protein
MRTLAICNFKQILFEISNHGEKLVRNAARMGEIKNMNRL